MRASPKDQRLEALEAEFNALLIPCLKECANGRWGLLKQNRHPEADSALKWVEADRLKELAEEIQSIRAEFGQPSVTCERFLRCCSERDENLPGEPKRAQKFLEVIGDRSVRAVHQLGCSTFDAKIEKPVSVSRNRKNFFVVDQ
jgi:hypothetical protein